ncbi:MAG: zf-TFIIB domain-containing protein [Pyrinomonadaceae bacterium]
MKIEALNCPNCGAGVQSDRTQCQFCKTRLKTIGCPTCFGLMFSGTKFCGHCGAIAGPVTTKETVCGNCPRCRRRMERTLLGGTSFVACVSCDGLWIDAATFENICADRERQSAVLGFLAERTEPSGSTKVSYVPCPTCGQLMNRSNFARASGVIVDICKQHGVWFDADELPTIIEFIRKGGMELARQREKNELNDEREQLRSEKRRLATQAGEFAGENRWSDEVGSDIRGFVRTLFG